MATWGDGLSGSINTTHMRISISAPSLAIFQSHMKTKADKLHKAREVILKKSIYVVEGKGKYYSPVDTGRMRASIGLGGGFGDKPGINFERLNEGTASVGPTVTYAKYVHARIPFMFTAAHESLGQIKRIAQDEVKKALN